MDMKLSSQKQESKNTLSSHFLILEKSISEEFQVNDQDKKRALNYYDQISRDYDRIVSIGFLKWFRNREKQAILSMADLSPPGTLIDVGCGGGFYSIAAKKAGYQVTSVDVVPSMLEDLKGRVDQILWGDVETLKLNCQFDRVLCLGVLDFVVNPKQAILNLCQLVAPGGRLVLFVPRVSWASWIYRFEKRYSGIRVNLYKIEWIQKCVEKEGLKLKDMKFPLPTNMVLAFESPKITQN